ncbi:MAG: hypothetical protein JWL97_1895 [Gemmatimonadales bacterium]|nr:hypothetical protein [Gemmatimonadales bacterium]
MTRSANARIAGFTFLFYIAVGVLSMVVFGRAASGSAITERLASIAQHTTLMGVVFLLALLQAFSAIGLGVTLYAITRDEDHDLAMAGLVFRVGEGLIGISIPTSLALLWLATASGPGAPDAASTRALGTFILALSAWKTSLSATFFAVGSLFFSWLFLRGRMIPAALAWLGGVASLLLVVGLPLQGAGFLRGPVTSLMWIPMAFFEVPFAVWLLVKGAAPPAQRSPA